MVTAKWEDRRRAANDVLRSTPVKRIVEALKLISSTHDTALSKQENKRQGDLDLDLAMALVWASKLSTFGSSVRKDLSLAAPSPRTKATMLALPKLESLPKQLLNLNDFETVNNLQQGGTGTVDIVRCKADKRVYVLKSVLKGVARREPHRVVPMIEKQILLRSTRDSLAGSSSQHAMQAFTPNLLASFQSKGSLHFVLEYFPAGDLEALLSAAGQADSSYPGKSRSGGLLQEGWVKGYALDVVASVAWLHEQGFAHRDIKPSNFLLHRSGHLKLCDFGTAAPFSFFEESKILPSGVNLDTARPFSPSSEQPTRRSRLRTSKKVRRVHNFFCFKAAGTCDYIAPEILLHEEAKLADAARRRCFSSQRDYSSSSAEDSCDESSYLRSSVASADGAPQVAADGPGPYGPEVDWWSVGVMLYEMTYGKLPFWAVSPEEAFFKIKHHVKHFSLDRKVSISPALRNLLGSLLTSADLRLGTGGSKEVKAHPFFEGMDWKDHWSLPPPFVPAVGGPSANQNSNASPMKALQEEFEPSILHSPLRGNDSSMFSSFEHSSVHLSAMFQGNVDDFPAFMDSFDQAQAAAGVKAMAANISTDVMIPSMNIPKLEDVDCDFLGFTYLPEADAFTVGVTKRASAPPSSPARRKTSQEMWLSSSPAAFEAASRRRALEELQPSANRSNYQTPARKSSLMMMKSGSSPSIAHATGGAAVPSSPYPFPIATSIRQPTPARAQALSAGALKRNDLARARSATPAIGGSSMGSVSRCSGGSNAKRDVSESQAWNEMMAAVKKSAKKVKQGRQWSPRVFAPATAASAGGRARARSPYSQVIAEVADSDLDDPPSPSCIVKELRARRSSSVVSTSHVRGPSDSRRASTKQDEAAAGISAGMMPTTSTEHDFQRLTISGEGGSGGGMPRSGSNNSIASVDSETDYGGNFVTKTTTALWNPPVLLEEPAPMPELEEEREEDEDQESWEGGYMLRHAQSKRQMRLSAMEKTTPSRISRGPSPVFHPLDFLHQQQNVNDDLSQDTRRKEDENVADAVFSSAFHNSPTNSKVSATGDARRRKSSNMLGAKVASMQDVDLRRVSMQELPLLSSRPRSRTSSGHGPSVLLSASPERGSSAARAAAAGAAEVEEEREKKLARIQRRASSEVLQDFRKGLGLPPRRSFTKTVSTPLLEMYGEEQIDAFGSPAHLRISSSSNSGRAAGTSALAGSQRNRVRARLEPQANSSTGTTTSSHLRPVTIGHCSGSKLGLSTGSKENLDPRRVGTLRERASFRRHHSSQAAFGAASHLARPPLQQHSQSEPSHTLTPPSFVLVPAPSQPATAATSGMMMRKSASRLSAGTPSAGDATHRSNSSSGSATTSKSSASGTPLTRLQRRNSRLISVLDDCSGKANEILARVEAQWE